MTGRTLTWTGYAGDLHFDTAANWTNGQGHVAKYAPDRADTVDLTGSAAVGTITGVGAVGTINVSGTFDILNASVIAGSIVDTGELALAQDTTMRARTVTIGGNPSQVVFAVAEDSTLSPAGAALDISVNFTQFGSLGALYVDSGGTIDLGAGKLSFGVGLTNNAPNAGALYMDGGTLTGDLYSAMSFGSAGGEAEAHLVNSDVLTSGAIDVGTGSSSIGSFSAQGGTVSAALLDVGTGGYGYVNFDETNVSLGSVAGVGLEIGGGEGSYQPSVVGSDNDTVTIFGRTEIGLSGKGAFGVGSSSTLTTNGGVDLGTAQTQGSTSGSGTLVIQSGGVWHDTGAVRLVSGVLDVAGYATTDTITGNLELGGPIGNLFSTSVSLTQATLDVTGTLAFHAAPFTSEFSTITIQNGATLNVGACNVGGGNNTITLYGAVLKTALTAGNLALGGDGATIGAYNGAILTIGTNPNDGAALIAGTLVLGTSSMSVTGGVVLTGDLELLSSNAAVTAASTALLCDAGQVLVQASTLSATGGLRVENGGSVIVDSSGTLTASAASGSDALVIGNGSNLDDESGVVALTGNATVAGTLNMTGGTLTDTGTIALTTGALVEGYCAISAPITVSGSATCYGSISFAGPVSGYGTIELAAQLTLLGAVANTTTMDFADPSTLIIGDAQNFGATIADWGSNDTLELLNVSATSDSVNGQTLVLYDGDDHVVASLRFAGSINTNDFALQQNQGNTTITHPS